MFGCNFLLQPHLLSLIKHAFYFATRLTSSQPFVSIYGSFFSSNPGLCPLLTWQTGCMRLGSQSRCCNKLKKYKQTIWSIEIYEAGVHVWLMNLCGQLLHTNEQRLVNAAMASSCPFNTPLVISWLWSLQTLKKKIKEYGWILRLKESQKAWEEIMSTVGSTGVDNQSPIFNFSCHDSVASTM